MQGLLPIQNSRMRLSVSMLNISVWVINGMFALLALGNSFGVSFGKMMVRMAVHKDV